MAGDEGRRLVRGREPAGAADDDAQLQLPVRLLAQHRQDAEVTQFTRFVVRGPRLGDYLLWSGAFADNGYGRFWLNRKGAKSVVRRHRYARSLARHLMLTGRL